jgi:hypothetical protein
MSSNTIRARMNFSFKGVSYELDTIIDLDRCLRESDEEPNFQLHLAKASGLDTYSYLYEVLESHDVEFSEATGSATQCCQDGGFDWTGFVRVAHEDTDLSVIRAIAERTLGVFDLDANAALKAALLAAYQAGKAGRAV